MPDEKRQSGGRIRWENQNGEDKNISGGGRISYAR